MEKVSVFAGEADNLFTYYAVEAAMLGRIGGSVPAAPASVSEMVVRQWMQATGKSRDEMAREDFVERVRMFLEELGRPAEELTEDAILRLAEEKAAGARSVFRRDAEGLWFPAHSMKAGMKEAINILYAKQSWGPTGKGPMNYFVEHVNLYPDHIALLREDGSRVTEADGIETLHGRVSGPAGPRVIVTEHEFVERPIMRFTMGVLPPDGPLARAKKDDGKKKNGEESGSAGPRSFDDVWPRLFKFMEENGIGSHRKLSDYGRFVITRFERCSAIRHEGDASSNRHSRLNGAEDASLSV